MPNRLAREARPLISSSTCRKPHDWYPWGEEALADCAQRTDVPIPPLDRLLGACH